MNNNPHIKFPVTTQTAQWISEFDTTTLTPEAYARAKHALLDYFSCTIAGQSEPLAGIMREEFASATNSPCTLVASNQKCDLYNAVLINGATGHALDYDDVHFHLQGHPTTCMAPAALTLGEYLKSSGREVLDAFIIGTEVACAIGEMMGDTHYDIGFHATGTMGTFGAAAVACRLMKLDVAVTTNALGIAASQASGLKANFGTMTKPFHAGKAAMNGVMAARLAARGFTASDVAIEGAQGFVEAQSSSFKGGPIRRDDAAPYAVEELLYKYHASCYLTHSTLNTIAALRSQHKFALDDVKSAVLKVRSTHAMVCCIEEPDTGLGIKFSIKHLAAMGLDGVNTGALDIFNDDNAVAPRFTDMRKNIQLDFTDDMLRTAVKVDVMLKDGQVLSATDDVGIPASDTTAQGHKLLAKFNAIATPVIGTEKSSSLIDALSNLETASDVNALMSAAG